MTVLLAELPRKGQNVEFKILAGTYQGTYNTFAEEVSEQGIALAHPMVGQALVPLSEGAKVRLEYSSSGARIAFTTAVRALEPGTAAARIVLAVPEKQAVERYQQRDFVRLNATLQLTFTVIFTPPEDEAVRPLGPFQSYTKDISGSGAQIMCAEPYMPGTQLDVHLDVKGSKIHTLAEVVRTIETLSDREHWVAIRFVGLSEKERDVIIRYIFQEQLARRKRGLL